MRRTLLAAALTIAATVGLAGPALAIDNVHCIPANGWLKIHFGGIAACFANAGSVNTDFPGTYQVNAGNNRGSVEFIDTDGVRRYRNFLHGEVHNLNYVRVVKVTIS